MDYQHKYHKYKLKYLELKKSQIGGNNKKNLVLITSVINIVKTPFNVGVRSVYSQQDRFDQTLYTIKSIKNYIPNPYIVLLEGSDLTKEQIDKINEVGCDQIYMVSKNIREHIDGPCKSVGELYILLDYLNNLKNVNEYETISKISGRYYLNDKFDWNKYPIDKAIYHCNKVRNNMTHYNTRYYRIPVKYYDLYKDILNKCLSDKDILSCKSYIELYNIFQIFPDKLEINKEKGEILGVEGNMGRSGINVVD